MMRIGLLLAVLAVSAGVFDAGADEELTPLRLQLQWVAQAQFAGYYAAQQLGFYAEEGLAVTLLESEGDISPAEAVRDGAADAGVTWAPKVLLANEGGAELVNIAQIFRRSGTVVVALPDAGIESPGDLVHRRVGYWPNGNEFEVYAMTFLMGSDPVSGEHLSLVEQPFDLRPLLDGDVDAAQALIYNGYGWLLGQVNPATGALYRESELGVIDMNEIGVAMLQDHIVARADWLAQPGHEAIATALLRATLRGWMYCREQADDCVSILREINPELGESHQQWQMNEVNKLIWPAPQGIGVMDSDMWAQTVEWLLRIGALEEAPGEGAYRTDLVERALEALQAEGLDVLGEGWRPAAVGVRAGGA